MQHTEDDQAVLDEIAAEYPGYHPWRSRQGGVPKSWCATLIDPDAGVDPTVIEPSPERLREALAAQRTVKATGRRAVFVFGL